MNRVLLIAPLLLLAACNSAPSAPSTPKPAPGAEAAPKFPDLAGRWNLEVFSRADEGELGTPNLRGELTLNSLSAGRLGGQYRASVRPDEFRAHPNDPRRLTYVVDGGFWRASKEWDAGKKVWLNQEQLSFQLRPTRLEIDGQEQEEGLPVNLGCSLYTGSRVEKPVSGKETYVVTCRTEPGGIQMNGWLERL
ncbi:MAG: hypothetical protein Q4C67_02120 [Deinococcus sp.]|nr:hypothetical protein [Deinococcus sp.]